MQIIRAESLRVNHQIREGKSHIIVTHLLPSCGPNNVHVEVKKNTADGTSRLTWCYARLADVTIDN